MNQPEISISSGVELLQQLDLDVLVLSGNSIAIENANYRVLTRQTVPSPALVKAQGQSQTIWLLPKLTRGLRLLAQEGSKLGFVGLHNQEVWLSGELLLSPKVAIARSSTKGKTPWAKFGVMRMLAQTATPRTQAQLANDLGITQPAISQALSTLGQLVKKTKTGWAAKDFDLIAQEFLASYPGPGGITMGWFSLDPIIKQAESVAAAYPNALLSADAAADQIAPWRLPRTAVVYNSTGLDLRPLGFVESPLERATLKVTVPTDPHLWQLAAAKNSNLADGLQVAYDLTQSAGTDGLEATEKLLEHLRLQFRAGSN